MRDWVAGEKIKAKCIMCGSTEELEGLLDRQLTALVLAEYMCSNCYDANREWKERKNAGAVS